MVRHRLAGIDVARGIAVLGMFAAHFNPYQLDMNDWLRQLVNGRSAALFALLAGVSVALISGGPAPRSGAECRVRRIRLAVRAVLLFGFGLLLTALGTPVKEILTVYGVLFLLAIPLLRLRTRPLAVSAGVLAALGPVLSFALRGTVVPRYERGGTPGFADFSSWHGLADVLRGLLLTGPYPVLTWLPFLLAGMAVGRLELRDTVVRVRLLVIGIGTAVFAYGLSWLLLGPLGGYQRMSVGEDRARAMADTALGAVPTADPEFLLITTGHSGAPLEIVATIGCAMGVIGASLLAADRFRRMLTPLASIGALALTGYAGHIVVIFVIGFEDFVHIAARTGYLSLVVLIVGTAIGTTCWRRWIGRGPLEWLVHRATHAVAPGR